jgi:tetratricopeptide (TPR) repeat protein
MAGVASLFTREFFEAARARLRPDGIICQWAHTYDISDSDLRSIAATFAAVFPAGTMWLVGDSDVLFIATNDAPPPQLENIARHWSIAGVSRNLAKSAVSDVFSVLSTYVGGTAELQRYGQGAVIQTDDRPAIEFSGPLGVYRGRLTDNAAVLRALLNPADAPPVIRAAIAAAGAPEWAHRGQMLLQSHAYATAYDSFARSARLDPTSEAALAGLIDAAASAQKLTDARTLLESLTRVQPARSIAPMALARLQAAMGDFDSAAALARQAISVEPENPRGSELLASILADAGDIARLRPLVARMQQMHPERADTWYYAAMVSFLGNDLPRAIADAERTIQISPDHALAHTLIGSASAALGRRDRAREAFRAALEISPHEPSNYTNLGLLELESGNPQAAAALFAESLTLDPNDERARANLPAALRPLR